MADSCDRVEIRGLRGSGSGPREHQSAGPDRPWIGVLFRCCNVYARVYRVRDGSRYVGWCPRCGTRIRAMVGSGGTSARMFEADRF